MSRTNKHLDPIKTTLYGNITKPVAAVVGVWDPFLPAHRQLFADLTAHAHQNNLCSLVIVINPDPGLLLWGKVGRPLYDDFKMRLHLIKDCGVDAILHLHFTKKFLHATANTFFTLVCSHVQLAEVWLGANQMLGNGPGGSLDAIRKQTLQRGIHLKVLPELGVQAIGYQIRGLLLNGELKQAIILAGHRPLRSRPRSHQVDLAWAPGLYQAIAIDNLATPCTGKMFEVHLAAGDDRLSHFHWPDSDARYLAFIAGPQDEITEVATEFEALERNKSLFSIINQSASLYDRINGFFVPLPHHHSNQQINAYLERWCKVVADGDDTAFAHRLAQEGYDTWSVRPLLGPVRLSQSVQLPPWISILRECLQTCQNSHLQSEESPIGFLDENEHLPFEELFLSCIHVAHKRLSRAAGKSLERLSETALSALERHLLRQITNVANKTLQLEFSIFKAQRQTSLNRVLSAISTDVSQAMYDEFVNTILAIGMVNIFEEYAVLARLIANSISLWIDFVTEFLFRLERDTPDIAQIFSAHKAMGMVTHVVGGISDNHNGGRSVLMLTFESGLRLVYKPKNVELEAEFTNLQVWLNTQGISLPFHPLCVIPRYGYGWVEFAPHQACSSQDEVERYFLRCGMLLCLIYILEGTDFHSENVIAFGEYPQLIDLETLLHHHFQATEDVISPSARALAEQQIWKSVLRTLFLPNWVVNKSGVTKDLSGLGGEYSLHKENHREQRATDYIQANLVYGDNGEIFAAGHYVDEISQGFQEMYEFLLVHQHLLVADDGPLSRFAKQQVRFVLRPTETYSALLQKTLQPEFLRDGVRSLEIDALSSIFIQDDIKAIYWPILHAEHQALEQLDVPYFSAFADETSLYLSARNKLPDFFSTASYPCIIENIRDSNHDDLSLQKQFIRLSFYAYDVQDTPTLTYQKEQVYDASLDPAFIGKPALIDEAVRIGHYLAKTAIYAPDESVTWIALQYHPYGKRYQLRPVGYDLYGGSAGIGLFLAAVASVTGISLYRKLALATVKSARQTMPSPSIGRRFASLMGIGGFSGMGSVIYALSSIASLLRDEACYYDACNAAYSITRELITADTRYDVMNGSAGLILALLNLYENGIAKSFTEDKRQELLNLAMHCGDHLLNSRNMSMSGYKAWLTLDGQIFTGFSHGAAGIAYALLRLFAATGKSSYQIAAQEAISYEQSIFVPAEENWPHYEAEPGKHEFLMQWCHGAPGIGLARIAALTIENSPLIHNDITNALNATLKVGFIPVDYLCCGNLGRARILLEASRQLKKQNLAHAAQKLASTVVTMARKQANEFTLGWNVAQATKNPGFMRGLSGIGYSLLEMADEDATLPVVLSLAGSHAREVSPISFDNSSF